MLFNSLEFAVFLPIVLALYAACGMRGPRLQNGLLIVASYVFYGWWDPRFLFLIVASTVVDYSAALSIDRGCPTREQRWRANGALVAAALIFATPDWQDSARLPTTVLGWSPLLGAAAWCAFSEFGLPAFARWPEERRRRAALTTSLVVNLGILGFFKYFDWFAESLAAAVEATFGVQLSPFTLGLVLPVGISFYTLQTISYSIDVYRRELPASRSLVDFAAYVAFFPQLVAGPIERGRQLIPQFQAVRRIRPEGIRDGLWLIAWGLFKKIAIADAAAVIVNRTFGPYDDLSLMTVPEDGVRVLVAIYAFALQIYADFSGYSDIARGTAKLLGFELMVNFRLPYFAVDPSSFWERWHISLSSWLRDYLYVPLGGNRRGRWRTGFNLSATMWIGGLWHGAAWTFVLWGVFHGAVLVIYRVLGLRRGSEDLSGPRSVLQGLVMFHLVCFGWLLFRAQNLETVRLFVASLWGQLHWTAQAGHDFYGLALIAWPLVAMQVAQWWSGRLDPIHQWPALVRVQVWLALGLGIAAHSGRPASEFIYFAF